MLEESQNVPELQSWHLLSSQFFLITTFRTEGCGITVTSLPKQHMRSCLEHSIYQGQWSRINMMKWGGKEMPDFHLALLVKSFQHMLLISPEHNTLQNKTQSWAVCDLVLYKFSLHVPFHQCDHLGNASNTERSVCFNIVMELSRSSWVESITITSQGKKPPILLVFKMSFKGLGNYSVSFSYVVTSELHASLKQQSKGS